MSQRSLGNAVRNVTFRAPGARIEHWKTLAKQSGMSWSVWVRHTLDQGQVLTVTIEPKKANT